MLRRQTLLLGNQHSQIYSETRENEDIHFFVIPPITFSNYVGKQTERALELAERFCITGGNLGCGTTKISETHEHRMTFVQTDDQMQKLDGEKVTQRINIIGPWNS